MKIFNFFRGRKKIILPNLMQKSLEYFVTRIIMFKNSMASNKMLSFIVDIIIRVIFCRRRRHVENVKKLKDNFFITADIYSLQILQTQ